MFRWRPPTVTAVVATTVGLTLAGCGVLPGLGGGSEPRPTTTVASSPTPVPPTASGQPSPSGSVRPTASVPPSPGFNAMERPKTSYPDPTFPKPPLSSAGLRPRLIYDLEKVVWRAAGSSRGTTTGTCAIAEVALRKRGEHAFTCTIGYGGVKVDAKVVATSGFLLTYRYTFDYLPLTRKKAEYVTVYSAYNGTAVRCDMSTDTVRVQVGDEQAVPCDVQTTDGSVDRYYVQMSLSGNAFAQRA